MFAKHWVFMDVGLNEDIMDTSEKRGPGFGSFIYLDGAEWILVTSKWAIAWGFSLIADNLSPQEL